MLQKTTLLLDFSILLVGCQIKKVSLPPSEMITFCYPSPAVVEEPLQQPDLAISDIALDETGRVLATRSSDEAGVCLLSAVSSTKDSSQGQSIKTEVRWDGRGTPVRLSLKRGEISRNCRRFQGRAPSNWSFQGSRRTR